MNERDLTVLLREHAGQHSVPGAALGILHKGTVTTACYGVADVRSGAPVTAGTRFSAGSLTKSMVATVVAGLAAAGRLSLDDPVAGHVPELSASDWAGRATFRDLLANRSGLPLASCTEFGFASRTEQDDRALSRLVVEAATAGPAGDFWSYTNVGWCVLGRVIETAAAAGWEDAPMARPGPPPLRRSPIFSGSPRCTWRNRRWPGCGPSTRRCRSTAGSMPGAWAGPSSAGTAARCGAGTA